MSDPKAIARRSYEAFARSDRAASEALLAEGFRFTSPLDNGIDRRTFYERCWPNHEHISGFRFIRMIGEGDEVFVTYEGETVDGRVFRNTELVKVHDGGIASVEVYFGWNLPHPAPENGFVDPPGSESDDEVRTIFGQVSCTDLEVSVPWFSKLFGRPPSARPMAGLAEWRHGAGGLQLHRNPDAAGRSTLTLIVRDLGKTRRRLDQEGLAPGEIERADHVSLARLRDPDDNLVVIARYHEPEEGFATRPVL